MPAIYVTNQIMGRASLLSIMWASKNFIWIKERPSRHRCQGIHSAILGSTPTLSYVTMSLLDRPEYNDALVFWLEDDSQYWQSIPIYYYNATLFS